MTGRKKTLQNFNLKTRDEITGAVAQIESALTPDWHCGACRAACRLCRVPALGA